MSLRDLMRPPLYPKRSTCPDCKSDERGFSLNASGVKYSGTAYALAGVMCMNGWHKYPYLQRLASGHYSTRKKKGASK